MNIGQAILCFTIHSHHHPGNLVLVKLSLGTELASTRAGPSQSSTEQFYTGLLSCVGGRTANFIYPEM